MDDLIAKEDYAEIYEVKDLDRPNDNCIRVYCTQAPDVFGFQIRTHKPINERFGHGKPRDMIAHVSLSIAEVEEILEYMKSQYPNMKRVNTSGLKRIEKEIKKSHQT